MSREGKGPGKEVRKGRALTEGKRGDQTQGTQVRRDTRKETGHEVRRATGETGRRSRGGSQPQGSTPSPPGNGRSAGPGRGTDLCLPLQVEVFFRRLLSGCEVLLWVRVMLKRQPTPNNGSGRPISHVTFAELK